MIVRQEAGQFRGELAALDGVEEFAQRDFGGAVFKADRIAVALWRQQARGPRIEVAAAAAMGAALLDDDHARRDDDAVVVAGVAGVVAQAGGQRGHLQQRVGQHVPISPPDKRQRHQQGWRAQRRE